MLNNLKSHSTPLVLNLGIVKDIQQLPIKLNRTDYNILTFNKNKWRRFGKSIVKQNIKRIIKIIKGRPGNNNTLIKKVKKASPQTGGD